MIAATRNSFFIALRYLAFHRVRTIILVAALAVILFVPAFLEIIVRESRAQLTARAAATPLLLGSPGSSLDLAMSSLYFVEKQPAPITLGDARALAASGLATSIPLHTAHRAGHHRIVGTSLDYFQFRDLRVARGRQIAFLGEAVIGNTVAATQGLEPGDTIVSTPENFIDIAGQYPLKMKIAGVLAPTGTADDEAVFVDLRTAWIISGIGHGHEDLATTRDVSVILKSEAGNIAANAKLVNYMEITPGNIDSFHFHGDQGRFPISAAIVVPSDAKSEAILLGRYQSGEQLLQLTRPDQVIGELVQSIFRIKRVLDAVVLVVAAATVLTVFLVFMLSLRLREKELATIFRLGCSRLSVFGFIAAEIAMIGGASIAIAAALVALANVVSPAIVMRLLVAG